MMGIAMIKADASKLSVPQSGGRKRLTCILIILAGASVLPGVAQAADGDSLTWNGLTFYGTFDIGVAYQSHGTPLSKDFYPGLEYLISKNSNRSVTSIAPDGISQSRLGLKGLEPLNSSVSLVFNLETAFVPTSGRNADALKGVANNNGRPLDQQRSGSDGSRAGQFFNGEVFAGLSFKDFGVVTFGRQNTPLLDAVIKYDPMGGSYAFSVIGYSGATAGMGNTENSRLNDSLKYLYKWKQFHVAAMYQLPASGNNSGAAGQIAFGGDFGGLSVDAIYGFKDRAVLASSLSAAQAAILPGDSLAATVSDNTSYTLAGSYTRGPWKAFAGYEYIIYRNPSDPEPGPFYGLGGYYFSVVNNTAYNHHKTLQVSWVGLRYRVAEKLDITGAVYHYDQNSYSGNGCVDESLASCSGTLNAYSARLDYHFSHRLDVYAGAMYSKVANGLASGYLFRSTIDPMVGFQYKF